MDINRNLDDNEIFELSRSQILEASGLDAESVFRTTSRAGLKRDFRVPADFVDGYIYGLDVSHWQGAINWQSVGAAKPAYVYVKATQGAGFVDPRVTRNVNGATNNGIVAGCYHFLSANTAVNSQVDHFLSVYEPFHNEGRLPPCMDLEWDYNGSGVDRWADKSKEFIGDKSLAWLEGVEAALGVKPIFYTNKNWFENRVGATNKVLNGYGVWMSRYGGYSNDAPPMMNEYKWYLWQFTDRGTVAGVTGRVDVNLSADGFPADLPASDPDKPYALSEEPLPQLALSADELAKVYDQLRGSFGGISGEQLEHLKVLVNTSPPDSLRRIVSGNVESPLSEAEIKRYFEIARDVLGQGALNQGQVNIINIMLKSASPDAIRSLIL